MSLNTTLLVTGGNRGLGRALAEYYLAQPNHVVIAGVRDLEHPSAQSLFDLPKGKGSSIITVKIESTPETDALDAVKKLESDHGITHLDIVIPMAGISKVFPTVSEVKLPDIHDHFSTNVIGVILLFQATLPLMNKAKSPKFITMGTSAASLGDMENRNFPNAAYGTSKAALHYITRKIHFENPRLTAFALDPGWVQTDMGNGGARKLGLEKAEVPVVDSVAGMVKVINGSSKDKTSGRFMFFDGSIEAW